MLIFISPSGNPISIKNTVIKRFGEAKYLYSSSLHNIFAHYLDFPNKIERDDLIALRESLSSERIDVLWVEELLDRSSKSLFAFDMDSTLIKEEVIDELARRKGVYDLVASVTKEAMEGKLDFDSALRKRCSYLVGIGESVFEEIYQSITPNDGVVELIPWIQKYKGIVAIFSGGFVPVIEKFAKKYSVLHYSANQLEMENGFTTGKVLGTIVNKNRKKELLIEHRDNNQILNSQTVAVGDGSNDSLMLNEAGIGIGFHAKSGLKKDILNWIDHHSMLSLLFLYDLRD
ncbi:MAG TPA: phosphoserine phosphatase SerB [Leptospiraceae bacterium]|nr:phosphoserine phosphatase SerB [Leptospiraceae bacterium]HMW03596.1 phosphoserine phosphatase SerB [Leptospiraceae bacterium]HMX35207.1 phosphoserine phosphatase SerB [Leptospiraceae bacterium]HMY29483.1 phosphoserine phosphatase SerB [Leptospiraceae bacterium]HMZ63596.1 phosphoserine phosphatase SerB [Leptospiraceae bacterium]